MQNAASGTRPGQIPARSETRVAALFGAAFTFIALSGLVAITGAPHSLPEVAQFPASTESFEVMPAAGSDPVPPAHALAPATGYADPGLQVTYDVYA